MTAAQWLQLETGELKVVADAQKGEYANETVFLTMADALERLEWQTYSADTLGSRCAALALFSDGLARLAMQLPSNAPHPPFFKPLFQFARKTKDSAQASQELNGFLSSERMNQRTDDDKTLILAVWPWSETVRAPATADESAESSQTSEAPAAAAAPDATID